MGRRTSLFAASLAIVVLVGSAGDSSADTWFATAPMSEPRAAETATLLASGQVLVAGGYNGFIEGIGGGHISLDSAELFNPSTEAWTQASRMRVARSGQTATKLLDGRVLVVGGWEQPECCTGTRTAEIYDPISNSWATIPSAPELQSAETATPLSSGRVLITGTFGADESTAVPGAALYDPTTNSWTAAAAPHSPSHHGQTATLLPTGNVLLLGGWKSETVFESGRGVEARYSVSGSAEEFEPATNTWRSAAPMGQVRADQTATLLPNGTILVTGGLAEISQGGIGHSRALASAEIYDPTTNTWRTVASMYLPRGQQTATLLPDGDVLVAGGYACGSRFCLGYGGSGNCCGASSAELYEPATDSWTLTAPVTTGTEHGAVLLPNGAVLVTGGQLSPGNEYELGSAEIYGPLHPPSEPAQSPPPRNAQAPTTAPQITNATQSNATWREGGKLAHISSRKKPPIGSTFTFALNEPATVTFAFTQRVAGRRAGHGCVAKNRKDVRRKTCHRVITVGALRFTGHRATNTVLFQGRISSTKKLKPGRYTLAITATNSSGARSAQASLTFTIVK